MITPLKKIIDTATKLHVAHINDNSNYPIDEIYKIPLLTEDDRLNQIIKDFNLSFQEQVILLLALVPYFAPQTLDIFLAKNPNFDVICTEFGGVMNAPHRGVIPTGETAVFLLAARNPERRKEIATLLLPEAKLSTNNLVELEVVADNLPVFSGKLIPHLDLVQLLMYGAVQPPKLSPQFPAQQLTTAMEWDDLIIADNTLSQLQDLQNWLKFSDQLHSHPQLSKRAKKGYRTLFYGPPGTGKTLTAALLGKSANRPVFRIDLSLLVSKYIGETEKNLAGVFKRAEHKNWILFFDEADALFSKRVETESSNDRFANQEVAYLLQRIEDYNGMVILASNLKQNMDMAFMRRFQALVHFPKPSKMERMALWERTLPADLPMALEIDLNEVVNRYELTASQISNVVQGCYIQALHTNEKVISHQNLMKNLRLEFAKEDLLFEPLSSMV